MAPSSDEKKFVPVAITMLNALSESLSKVNHDIDLACERFSRPRDRVKLVAVSKGHDFSLIEQAYALGQRDFGESYAQELATKMEQAEALGLSDIIWHFIGAIQSNKLKIIKNAQFIHSVASMDQAIKLHDKLDDRVKIFLQININEDFKRKGFLPSDVVTAISSIKALPRLEVVGLMTILPLKTSEKPKIWFDKMATTKQQILSSNLMSDVQLSMGMSNDFLTAIEWGANVVRVGEKIFGPRT